MEILLKQILTIVHLFGTALGAGGAFVSDFVFLKSVKDKRVDKVEFSFLKLMSGIVWLGLFLLVVSGAGLFWLNSERLIHSSKFLAKMTIVLVIILNGILFHFLHIPIIGKSKNTKLFSELPTKNSVALILSGIASVTSWASALILGSLRNVPLSYPEFITLYIALLALGTIVAPLVLRKVLDSKARRAIAGVALVLVLISGVSAFFAFL